MAAEPLGVAKPPALASLVRDIAALEALFDTWDADHQGAMRAYRTAIEDLHREAIRRLIASLKQDPGALAHLKQSLSDEVVYGVLRHLGLLKPSLQEKVEAALQSVRPMLASHGGDVELVRLVPPTNVEVRFTGACDGCAASQLTFVAGVKKAIQDACPEIQRVVEVRGLAAAPPVPAGPPAAAAPASPPEPSAWAAAPSAAADPARPAPHTAPAQLPPMEPQPKGAGESAGPGLPSPPAAPPVRGRVRFRSPFALDPEAAGAIDVGWLPAAHLAEIPLGGVLRRQIGGRDLLLSRTADAITCFTNACAHLGLPIDRGEIEHGVLTCPHHGFQYLLDSGECLTAPMVQLEQHAVRLIDDRVEIRLSR